MEEGGGQLERHLEKSDDVSKGRVVLATVFGDVHDIGKNLVKTILSNNGYTVFDLGKQVPVQTILDKAREVDATAIGLSALLVSTSKQMPVCVGELHRAGLCYPVLIGGAAINRNFGRRAALVDGEEYERLIRDDFEPRRLALQREAERERWIRPGAVRGYFPCQSDGQDLVIFDPASFAPGALTPRGKIEELLRFTFPRQADREGL